MAGLDEAGRGALAGPVFAGAVVLPWDRSNLAAELYGVRDSKQLTPYERERLASAIQQTALCYSVGKSEPSEIDRLGIAPATRLACLRALAGLTSEPEHLLLDYFLLPESELPQTALIKGDQRCLSIACASVLAKTARDAFMREQAERYPGFGFETHKGYGTAQHRKAITENGLTDFHRKSFH